MTGEKNFLIVKTSAIGDIIQAINILDYLHMRFPKAKIDWVVEKNTSKLIEHHPLVDQTIVFHSKNWRRGFLNPKNIREFRNFYRTLRKKTYDVIFDLQGNCKSAMATFFARGKVKVGFGRKSVREWPNLLVTKKRIEVHRGLNIRLQYLSLIQKYFEDTNPIELQGVRLSINEKERLYLNEILKKPEIRGRFKVMVCPWSKWPNKQLNEDELRLFLEKMYEKYSAGFLFMWGTSKEKLQSEKLQKEFSKSSVVVEKLSLIAWQNLIHDVDLVFCVDSSALHLSGTTPTPTFSVFGPTSLEVFKPIGKNHFAVQGSCPYNKVFLKQCPLLRTCSTGACIRQLEAKQLFLHFSAWWETLLASK